MLRQVLPLAALALAGCATAETVATTPPPVARSVPTVPVPLMQQVISRFASDELEGRGPGTRAEDLLMGGC